MNYESRRSYDQQQDQALAAAMNQLGVTLEKGPEWTVVLGLLRGGWPGTPTKADEVAYITFLSDLDPGDVARALKRLSQQGQKYRPTPAEVRPHVQTTVRLELTASVRDTWHTLRTWLQNHLHPSGFAMWIEPLRLAGAAGSILYLAADHRIRTWTERRYLPLLRQKLPDLTDEYQDVQIIHDDHGQAIGPATTGHLEPGPPTK